MVFQIGDRVKCVFDDPDDNGLLHIGCVGTVCDASPLSGVVGVEWDDFVGGHDCGGRCARGHGWNVLRSEIELLDDDITFEFSEEEFYEMLR